MALNFKILIDQSGDCVHLSLYDDFDGSSALELIHLLMKYQTRATKIRIHTEGLNQIYSFGLNVFGKSFGIIRDCANRIAFSGDTTFNFTMSHADTSL